MQMQFLSDVHIEFLDTMAKYIEPKAKVLALLGDICCAANDEDFIKYKAYVNELLPHFSHILIVTGNHEYFTNSPTKLTPSLSLQAVNKKIEAFCRTSPKLHFLNNKSIQVKSGKKTYLFIGTTLWTWIPEAQRARIQDGMNDYAHIYVNTRKGLRKLLPADVCAMHKRAVKFIEGELLMAKQRGYKAIVLSHHKPYKSNAYDENTHDPAYESDLSALFKPPLVAWAYGHTHKYDKSIKNNILFYSNPKGYPHQRTNYNKGEIIEL